MVFMQFDIKNDFGSLCTRLVLDVMSVKTSRDYSCGIKVDEDFETTVHELRKYFGFFKLPHTCASVLRFYSYDGTTNYLKLITGGLQGDYPEFMVFCHVTLHLWGHLLKMFPELRGLGYAEPPNRHATYPDEWNSLRIARQRVAAPTSDELIYVARLGNTSEMFPDMSMNQGPLCRWWAGRWVRTGRPTV